MNATVIIPSLNPDEKMVNTVKGLIAEGFEDIILVDDGSRENCKKYFMEVESCPQVHVLTHDVNMGKGRAMKTAFEYILDNKKGISGVVTVDGDGQHLPKDIRNCVEEMEREKDKVILGVRDFSGSSVPARSKFGNNMTKAVFRFACGIRISDTQTGLRAIPFKYLPLMLKIEGERYEYETNQLLMIKKQNIKMSEVVINTVYIDANSSSHFNPIKDSIKIYMVIFKFIGSSLASFVVDTVLFTLINIFLERFVTGITAELRLLIATVGARAVSSLVNYTMNRRYVFESKSPVAGSMARYYTLCVCQTFISYFLTFVLSDVVFRVQARLLDTLIKIVVDMCLFFVSFQIQQRWVFKESQDVY